MTINSIKATVIQIYPHIAAYGRKKTNTCPITYWSVLSLVTENEIEPMKSAEIVNF